MNIPKPFAVGRYAVTRGEFAAFIAATDHAMDGGAHVWDGKEWKLDSAKSWRDPGFNQDDRHPVVCTNWNDAKAYIAWINGQVAGKPYRLLSEAEWEYCYRAGNAIPSWWGGPTFNFRKEYPGGGNATPFWWAPPTSPKPANYGGRRAIFTGEPFR